MRREPAQKKHLVRLWSVMVLFLTLLSGLFGCGGGDSKSSFASDPDLNRAVERARTALEATINRTAPSLSVLIQTPEAAYFFSSVSPGAPEVTPDTYFRFASNTKNFTAAAILKMHQDGWLNYTDRIVENIPGSDIPYVPDTAAWNIPYKDRITIRQLLQHNAGVYDVDNDPVPGCNGMSYVSFRMKQDQDHQFTSSELVKQNVIHNLSYFVPGTVNHHYSNTGYTILSEIIARTYSHQSGDDKTYADYLRDYVHGRNTPAPLRIRFPFLSEDRHLPSPHVCGIIYTAPDGEAEKHCSINMSAHVAEGNGYGTMRDLNTYIRTLLKGQNVLSMENIERMMTDVSPGAPGYALGTIHVENLGYGHNGAIYGNMSLMLYDPATDVSVIVLLPVWDESRQMESLAPCFNTLNCAGWAAREALGYPGKPAAAVCPGD